MPRGITPVWIHDVTHPVSWKWFCYRDDVLLLQYALNKFMAKEKLLDFNGKPTIGPMGREWPPLAPLAVDGIFGNKTHGALTAFQRNRCVAVDGDADPVYKYIAGLGGDPVSPHNMQIMTSVYGFTMFKLNSEILRLYGRLMDDTELPADVQTALRNQHQ